MSRVVIPSALLAEVQAAGGTVTFVPNVRHAAEVLILTCTCNETSHVGQVGSAGHDFVDYDAGAGESSVGWTSLEVQLGDHRNSLGQVDGVVACEAVAFALVGRADDPSSPRPKVGDRVLGWLSGPNGGKFSNLGVMIDYPPAPGGALLFRHADGSSPYEVWAILPPAEPEQGETVERVAAIGRQVPIWPSFFEIAEKAYDGFEGPVDTTVMRPHYAWHRGALAAAVDAVALEVGRVFAAARPEPVTMPPSVPEHGDWALTTLAGFTAGNDVHHGDQIVQYARATGRPEIPLLAVHDQEFLRSGQFREQWPGQDLVRRVLTVSATPWEVVMPSAPDPDEDLIARVAQAIRDSNGTPEALAAWKQHPQTVPAHVYAKAAIDAIRGGDDG